MSLMLANAKKRMSGTRMSDLDIRQPFTIPSGVVTTTPAVIARIAKEVPEIGFLTTKTVSLEPRTGYREPIIHEYHPGCFVNAVGLANPGAEQFLNTMRPLLPLDAGKPLIVSIMGADLAEFLECARVLDPIADAFELNLSCPHVKGAGQSIGSDPEMVRTIMRALRSEFSKPIIPKLSPNLPDLVGMARLCEEMGADGLSLINTVGPGVAADQDANPILSNVSGGLSGSGIFPIGLRSVEAVAAEVNLPIIASGGIGSAAQVNAYMQAGAALYAVGSSLAGMTTVRIRDFFAKLVQDLETGRMSPEPTEPGQWGGSTTYVKTEVTENRNIGDGIFRIRLKAGPPCAPGSFFFLRLPGVGEKPFSPACDVEPEYLVRAVGPFTRALESLAVGDPIYVRGPYGNGFPEFTPDSSLILVGGGTGVAPLMMAASRLRDQIKRGFIGFSHEVDANFSTELVRGIPSSRVVIDPPDRPGEVVRVLEQDMEDSPDIYENCRSFLCGPMPMMQAALSVLRKRTSADRIFMAREDIMRCGIGVCGSCGTEGGLRSCVDGPVMNP